jgi:tight adherence protein C
VPWPPPRRLSARSWAALAVGAAALIAGVWGLVAGALVVGATAAVVRSRRRRHRRELEASVAEAVPLLQLAVQSGLNVRASLTATAPWMQGELATAVRAALARSEAGVAMADALDDMAQRLGRGVLPLTTVLAAADRYGAPLGGPLGRLGGELRLQRRRQLEKVARRLPVTLLFPLVAGVLPAFVCLAVVPLVASSLHGVSLGGG